MPENILVKYLKKDKKTTLKLDRKLYKKSKNYGRIFNSHDFVWICL